MQKFEIGDWVYAGDWCYGQIAELKDDYAYVEFDTGSGGGCLPFELGELQRAPEPDILYGESLDREIRDNLLVTAGARAAYMDCKSSIDIPGGLEGEDELANFVTTAVDTYLENGDDTPFDEYIESKLMAKYGKGE